MGGTRVARSNLSIFHVCLMTNLKSKAISATLSGRKRAQGGSISSEGHSGSRLTKILGQFLSGFWAGLAGNTWHLWVEQGKPLPNRSVNIQPTDKTVTDKASEGER